MFKYKTKEYIIKTALSNVISSSHEYFENEGEGYFSEFLAKEILDCFKLEFKEL